MSVNETVVEAKMCTFTLESTHFIFNKCPIYTHDGASDKLSTDSHETDYMSAVRSIEDNYALSVTPVSQWWIVTRKFFSTDGLCHPSDPFTKKWRYSVKMFTYHPKPTETQ